MPDGDEFEELEAVLSSTDNQLAGPDVVQALERAVRRMAEVLRPEDSKAADEAVAVAVGRYEAGATVAQACDEARRVLRE